LLFRKKTSKLSFVAIMFKLACKCDNRPRMTFFIQKCYTMHCGVRLHGQNACYVIFWNITPKHWKYMDTGYCNSLYFCLWLYNYLEYVIECIFAVERHILLKIWLILRIWKNSTCGSLSTSNIEYGDIMIGFFSILQIFPGRFW
jgi:hypothetical protein